VKEKHIALQDCSRHRDQGLKSSPKFGRLVHHCEQVCGAFFEEEGL